MREGRIRSCDTVKMSRAHLAGENSKHIADRTWIAPSKSDATEC
jgi:hypothetical protein